MVARLGVTTIASDPSVRFTPPAAPWRIARDEWSSLPLTLDARWRPWQCRQSLHILLWIRSLDGRVLLSAPAVPMNKAAARRGELTARFKILDAGAYNVSVITVQTNLSSFGGRALYHDSHNPGAVLLAAPPATLLVTDSQASSEVSFTSSRVALHLPTTLPTCQLFGTRGEDVLREQLNGRWIRCNAISSRFCEHHACLRDGWLFAPWGCRHKLHTAGEAHLIATKAQRRRQRPLWIVFMGSSIIRGAFHSLVDVLAAKEVAPLFANALSSSPGVGSTTKCWGWSDVRISNALRLSFQDFRLAHYVTDASNATRLLPAIVRLTQLLKEGPDLIVMESFEHIRYSDPGTFGKVIAGLELALRSRSADEWRGRLVLTAAKESAATFGMEGGYCDYPESGEDFVSSSSKAFEALMRRLRPEMRSRLAYWNEDEMAWPMFFDMEAPLKAKGGELTVHWHRYNLWRGQSGSTNSHRGVAGIVSEMSAQIYLSALIAEAGDAEQLQSNATSAHHHHHHHHDEHPKLIEVCNECPLKACCPWQAPIERPAHSLSRAAESLQWLRLEELGLAGCGRTNS